VVEPEPLWARGATSRAVSTANTANAAVANLTGAAFLFRGAAIPPECREGLPIVRTINVRARVTPFMLYSSRDLADAADAIVDFGLSVALSSSACCDAGFAAT
jgi:hypothetical protein